MKHTIKLTKFLLCVDKEKNDLYILHREYPACLIYVEQTVPLNFVALDLFEDIPPEEARKLLTSEPFKKELKDFFNSQAFDTNKN